MEKIRDAATAGEGATPGKTTVLACHDVLERLWVADNVPGWSPSTRQLTKLGQTLKRRLDDPALAVALNVRGPLSDGRRAPARGPI